MVSYMRQRRQGCSTHVLIDDQRHELAHWLSGINVSDKQRVTYNTVSPGTGQWLLNHPDFKHWRDEEDCSSRILWCHGDGTVDFLLLKPFSHILCFSWCWEDEPYVRLFVLRITDRPADLGNLEAPFLWKIYILKLGQTQTLQFWYFISTTNRTSQLFTLSNLSWHNLLGGDFL
jgi:hypothetical protein